MLIHAESAQPRWHLANIFAVPGTGRHRRYSKFLRSPRHIGTKRALIAFDGTFRGTVVPPSDWDDIRRGSVGDRCWKRYRPHRWHGGV